MGLLEGSNTTFFFNNSLSFKLLTKEEKMVYTEKARKWNEKCTQKTVKEVNAEKGPPFNVAK